MERLSLLAPRTDVTTVIECLPSGAERFPNIAFEPGAIVGYAATLLVTALHVTPELDIARAVWIADVTEKKCAISHEPRSLFLRLHRDSGLGKGSKWATSSNSRRGCVSRAERRSHNGILNHLPP